MKNQDISTKKFYRLTVLKDRTSVKSSAYMCLCLCDCGQIKEISRSNLMLGKSKSCGCLAKELTSKRSKTHGMSKTPVYAVWNRMWSRCTNPKVERYLQYGGRGIAVCDRWINFEQFFQDMGDLPTPNHSIGRKDNNRNYEPDNCEWETRKQQANNTSRSSYIECDGEKMTVSQWAEKIKMLYATISQQKHASMPINKIMNHSKEGLTRKFIVFDGYRKMTTEWMQDLSIPISSFYHFRRKGMTDSEIVARYAELKAKK